MYITGTITHLLSGMHPKTATCGFSSWVLSRLPSEMGLSQKRATLKFSSMAYHHVPHSTFHFGVSTIFRQTHFHLQQSQRPLRMRAIHLAPVFGP